MFQCSTKGYTRQIKLLLFRYILPFYDARNTRAIRANIVFPAFVSIRLLIFHSLEYIFSCGEFPGNLQCHQCCRSTSNRICSGKFLAPASDTHHTRILYAYNHCIDENVTPLHRNHTRLLVKYKDIKCAAICVRKMSTK